jgi:hypothetical protein
MAYLELSGVLVCSFAGSSFYKLNHISIYIEDMERCYSSTLAAESGPNECYSVLRPDFGFFSLLSLKFPKSIPYASRPSLRLFRMACRDR